MQAIITKFHEPTNTKGARVSATIQRMGKTHRVMVPYDHSIMDGTHIAAAKKLLTKLNFQPQLWWECGSLGDDYVFVQRSSHGTFCLSLDANENEAEIS